MPPALRIGLPGPLRVRDETGHPVRADGRQLRVLLTLPALNAGRVVPAGSLAGQLWPDDPPGNPGSAIRAGSAGVLRQLTHVTLPRLRPWSVEASGGYGHRCVPA